jgi:hypothetical protein
VVTGLVVSLLCCRPADGIHGLRCHDDAMFFLNLYVPNSALRENFVPALQILAVALVNTTDQVS